jgi:hypothetical protein
MILHNIPAWMFLGALFWLWLSLSFNQWRAAGSQGNCQHALEQAT